MRRTFIAAALATAVFAGCGGGDDEPEPAATPAATAAQEESAGGGGGEALALAAPEDGSLKFDKTELTAPAGTVTIEFSNPSQVPHAVAVEGNGVDEVGQTVTAADAPPLSAELEPGTYTFYCPVGGHRAAGMEGTLTVE